MRSLQIVFAVILGLVFVVAGYFTVQSFFTLWSPAVAEVKSVPAGSHEIAWIGPAANTTTWERIVEAADYLCTQWPPPGMDAGQLRVNVDNAFPPITAGVPEIVLWIDGKPDEKVYLRWYKISSVNPIRTWIDLLSKRSQPPLAILGGGSTTRAVELSLALRDYRNNWDGPAPVFLITTATADAYRPGGQEFMSGPDALQLMDIYEDRNYRFSFTNSHMAAAVLDFVQEHPEMWPPRPLTPATAASVAACADPFTKATLLGAENYCLDYAMYGIAWKDDKYSTDLRDRFLTIFRQRFSPSPDRMVSDWVTHSTGDRFNPNSQDISAADLVFAVPKENTGRLRHLLILPTGADRARRFLKPLINGYPDQSRNVVVLSGDSIGFNDIFRDRKTSWSSVDLPVPLIFFCHRNPVSVKAGFRAIPGEKRPWASTGTQDLLFYRDILEAIAAAAYGNRQSVKDADEFNQRLHDLHWSGERCTLTAQGDRLFNEKRNRRAGTGERVIQLQPNRNARMKSSIRVWSRTSMGGSPQRWKLDAVIELKLYGEPEFQTIDKS